VECPRGWINEISCYTCPWWNWKESDCRHVFLAKQISLFPMKKATGVKDDSKYRKDRESKAKA